MQTCSAPLSCCVSLHLTQCSLSDARQGQLKSRTGRRQKPSAAPADRGTSVMSFWPSNTKKFEHSRPIIECAQCGEWLFGPEWSEYIDERYVRHLWRCEPCCYACETTVSYARGGLKHRIFASDRYAIRNHRFVSCFCKRQEVCNRQFHQNFTIR
jgi:hypothetical protein